MTRPPTYDPGDRVQLKDVNSLRELVTPAPDLEEGDRGEVVGIEAGPDPSVGIFGYTYEVRIDRTDEVELIPDSNLSATP